MSQRAALMWAAFDRAIALASANTGKHGDLDPLTREERLAKIVRHAGKALSGWTDEDHLAAIIVNAALCPDPHARHAADR